VARELASHLRLKRDLSVACKEWCSSGEGTGFSSEIETPTIVAVHSVHDGVARELASHLRLKLSVPTWYTSIIFRGEGTGFSSEIETKLWYAAHDALR